MLLEHVKQSVQISTPTLNNPNSATTISESHEGNRATTTSESHEGNNTEKSCSISLLTHSMIPF